MIILKTDRLMAMIAEPGVAPNNNFRFSRAGAVTQVVLDGSYYFCASEPHHLAHPSSGGCGLMNEFLFDVSNEAKDGEYFPKIGIGLLRKDKEGYAMYRRYDPEEVQLFPITFECSENTIVFEIQPLPCMGYAFRQTRKIELVDNALWMHDQIFNVGEKSFSTEEYCHNFMTINGLALGPTYHFSLPDLTDRGFSTIAGTIKGEGRGLSYTGYNHAPASFDISGDDIRSAGTFQWSLYNTEGSYDRSASCRIDVMECFQPSRLGFWAVDHMMSLEVFKSITLAPGEDASWSRQYTFSA